MPQYYTKEQIDSIATIIGTQIKGNKIIPASSINSWTLALNRAMFTLDLDPKVIQEQVTINNYIKNDGGGHSSSFYSKFEIEIKGEVFNEGAIENITDIENPYIQVWADSEGNINFSGTYMDPVLVKLTPSEEQRKYSNVITNGVGIVDPEGVIYFYIQASANSSVVVNNKSGNFNGTESKIAFTNLTTGITYNEDFSENLVAMDIPEFDFLGDSSGNINIYTESTTKLYIKLTPSEAQKEYTNKVVSGIGKTDSQGDIYFYIINHA